MDWKHFSAALSSSILATGAAHAADARQPADVLIRGGTVHTGEAVEPRLLDIVLTGDSITYVGTDAAARFNA